MDPDELDAVQQDRRMEVLRGWTGEEDLGPPRRVLKRTPDVVVTLERLDPGRGGYPMGEYVLKSTEKRPPPQGRPPELDAHDRAKRRPRFGDAHVPDLVRKQRVGDHDHLLFCVPGRRFEDVRLAEGDDPGLPRVYEAVSEALLWRLRSDPVQQPLPRPQDLFRDWLEGRLWPNDAGRMYRTEKALADRQPAFGRAEVRLPNPLLFLKEEHLEPAAGPGGRFVGLVHGDLTRSNLLVTGLDSHPPGWWLIDWEHSSEAPLFYDQAYLEVDLILGDIPTCDPERLFGLLADLERPPRRDAGLATVLRAIRGPVDAWQAELAPGLAVDVDKQVLLARVAAGLRWSNIAREEPARHLAFFYAAWMARDYVQRFWRDFWKLADERFAPTVSIPRALPRDWSVRWLPDDYHTELPPKPALLLARARLEGSGFATLCQGFTSSGLRDVWGRDTFDDGEKEVFLLPFPVLDDMWTLWLWVAALDGRRLHESWSAMCSYTGDVRLGLWPDETDPECAPQAVYRALVQRNLHQGVRDRTRFVTEALTFCSHVAEQLEAGARLGRDDLFGGQPDLGRYVRILRGDHQRYQTDLASGGRFWAHLPSSTEAPGIPHTASLLALAFPTATLFDYWARHDPEAPDGVGYDLLLVEDWTGTVWLSADPEKGKHLQLGFVAHHLTGLERKACGADAQTWYDGADHWGTLVRSPMRGGALSWDVFMDALGELLVLEPIR